MAIIIDDYYVASLGTGVRTRTDVGNGWTDTHPEGRPGSPGEKVHGGKISPLAPAAVYS